VHKTTAAIKGNGTEGVFIRGVSFCQRQPRQGKENEIIAQRQARALTRATSHRAAQSAVYAAIILVFAQLQFRRVGANVADHRALSFLVFVSFISYPKFQNKAMPFCKFSFENAILQGLFAVFFAGN
jgi:hypothetical protein